MRDSSQCFHGKVPVDMSNAKNTSITPGPAYNPSWSGYRRGKMPVFGTSKRVTQAQGIAMADERIRQVRRRARGGAQSRRLCVGSATCAGTTTTYGVHGGCGLPPSCGTVDRRRHLRWVWDAPQRDSTSSESGVCTGSERRSMYVRHTERHARVERGRDTRVVWRSCGGISRWRARSNILGFLIIFHTSLTHALRTSGTQRPARGRDRRLHVDVHVLCSLSVSLSQCGRYAVRSDENGIKSMAGFVWPTYGPQER